jgi:hypothetical protein
MCINIFLYKYFALYLYDSKTYFNPAPNFQITAYKPPLTKLLYRLKGWGLFLLQTQYAKKPKNPV